MLDHRLPAARFRVLSAARDQGLQRRRGAARTSCRSRTDGSALLELFTHDGVGTMVSFENLESLRDATIEDVGGILKLIEPLEADGTLVKRGRELIEREINDFSVIEHDGVIFGCAALYPFPAENMAEMACLTVNPEVQAQGDGERLLNHIENRARAAGLKKLFVLTTRTAHWFLKRGFVPATVDTCRKTGSTCTTGSANRWCSRRTCKAAL